MNNFQTTRIVRKRQIILPAITAIAVAISIILTHRILSISHSGNCIPFELEELNLTSEDKLRGDTGRYFRNIATPLRPFYRRKISGPSGWFKLASRSCTFTLGQMKNFLYKIEQEAHQLGDSSDTLAVTWFYAMYDSAYWAGSKDYRLLQTLYGVPSVIVNGIAEPKLITIQQDFSPVEIATATADIGFIQQGINRPGVTTPQTSTQTLILSGEPGDDAFAGGFNQGQLCPPDCRW